MKKEIPFLIGVGIIAAAAIIAGIIAVNYEKGGVGIADNNDLAQTTTPSSTTPAGITYTNSTYGFTLSLPDDWQGYTVVTSAWNGYGDESCPANGCPPVTGPELLVRNPHWTASDTWQDIPILVFTHSEWTAVATGTLAVSAAPIPPSELGENSDYVLALPARYNYAYPNGWQEVQSIIAGNPLHGFDPSSSTYQGKQVCQTDSDCPSDDVCTVAGPIRAGAPTSKTCWPQGSAIPL